LLSPEESMAGPKGCVPRTRRRRIRR
jgi:hypothetical protein